MEVALPRTWKLCTDKIINKIYDEVYKEAQSLGLLSLNKEKHPLYITKSVKTWGM